MDSVSSLTSFQSSFKLDERDILFQLFNVLAVDKTVLNTPQFRDVDRDSCIKLIDASIRFAREYLGRSYQVADKHGCERISSSEVLVPRIYKMVWAKYKEIGLCKISAPIEYGGLGAPYVVNQAVYSILYGTDPSFCVYPGFNIGAVYLLKKFGTEEQQRIYCQPLVDATMTASLVMSEPDAGSDVGSIRTKAYRGEGGRYRIEGHKIFISSGMHDLTDNIVYFVLARLEGAPPGTSGLSCFVVTKYCLNDDGSPGEYNNVGCVCVENKMGLRGNATVQLSFGLEGPCYGSLLGGRENIGLSQLMMLMNLARVATGTYALGIASSAYFCAVDYASRRIQGTSLRATASARAPRLPIIEHLDVKRMLLDMKSKVEGMRSLVLKAANYLSIAVTLSSEAEETRLLRRRYEALADLLIPVVKAYCSDQGWLVCETAIQVHGGYGYISDFPVEQYCRDIKIMSIWEGTNYMQAADLVRSKLSLGKTSKNFSFLKDEISSFREQTSDYPELIEQLEILGTAVCDIDEALENFGRWLSSREMEQIYLMATRFMNVFGDFIVGWLLLENAAAALRAMRENNHEYDSNFLEGKIFSMRYFFKNTLCHLKSKLKAISTVDDDFKHIGAAHFSRPH